MRRTFSDVLEKRSLNMVSENKGRVLIYVKFNQKLFKSNSYDSVIPPIEFQDELQITTTKK